MINIIPKDYSKRQPWISESWFSVHNAVIMRLTEPLSSLPAFKSKYVSGVINEYIFIELSLN